MVGYGQGGTHDTGKPCPAEADVNSADWTAGLSGVASNACSVCLWQSYLDTSSAKVRWYTEPGRQGTHILPYLRTVMGPTVMEASSLRNIGAAAASTQEGIHILQNKTAYTIDLNRAKDSRN